MPIGSVSQAIGSAQSRQVQARLNTQRIYSAWLDAVDAATASATALRVATATVITPVSVPASSLVAGGITALASCARQLQFTTAGGTPADAPATVTIRGCTALGSIVEVLALAQTATTANSLNYYMSIESLDYPPGDGVGATIAVGFTANLGLPAKLKGRGNASAVFPFLTELMDGAVPTAGAFISPATALPCGAYTPSSAPNAARDFLVQFEVDPQWG